MTPRGWLLFALSSVIWGVPYLFIKVAVDAGVPPAFVAWARVALAAALLLPVALRCGALGPVAASLALATIALLPAAIASPPHAIPAPAALGVIARLGVVCTALGLVVFFELIAEAGPAKASVLTYVNPLVAVVVGVLALDEHVGAMSVVGLALILGGSWLSAGGLREDLA